MKLKQCYSFKKQATIITQMVNFGIACALLKELEFKKFFILDMNLSNSQVVKIIFHQLFISQASNQFEESFRHDSNKLLLLNSMTK
jgi:hypothetical protein